jgi:polysaccharide biosynthesis protein PslH
VGEACSDLAHPNHCDSILKIEDARLRILFITDFLPYPILGGASLRNYNILHRIALENQVWLAAFSNNAEQIQSIAHLRNFCESVETADCDNSKGALWHPWQYVEYALTGRPPEFRFYSSRVLEQKIKRLVDKISFDVIQIDQVHMGMFLNAIPTREHKRTIWSLHDIDFVKFSRIIKHEPKLSRKVRLWVNNRFVRYWEPRYARKFARCITVSDLDRRLLQTASPGLKVDSVPNGVDVRSLQPLPPCESEPALLFVGNMSYLPCIDAVLFFYHKILPFIEQAIGSVDLWIVGREPSVEVRGLEQNRVHVTGTVPDVRPYYEKCTVCIVPLRAGGGTRLKILEAMALGRPVVSTSIGCEGLDVKDGQHLFIEDEPNQFAEKTVRLIQDREIRHRITRNARDLVESTYDWDIIARKMMRIYQEVAR